MKPGGWEGKGVSAGEGEQGNGEKASNSKGACLYISLTPRSAPPTSQCAPPHPTHPSQWPLALTPTRAHANHPLTQPVAAERGMYHAHERPGVGLHVGLAGPVPGLTPSHRCHHQSVRVAPGLHGRHSRGGAVEAVPEVGAAPRPQGRASRHPAGNGQPGRLEDAVHQTLCPPCVRHSVPPAAAAALVHSPSPLSPAAIPSRQPSAVAAPPGHPPAGHSSAGDPPAAGVHPRPPHPTCRQASTAPA